MYVAKRVELFEKARGEARGFGKGSGCRGIQPFSNPEPTTRQCPLAVVRVAGAPDEGDSNPVAFASFFGRPERKNDGGDSNADLLLGAGILLVRDCAGCGSDAAS